MTGSPLAAALPHLLAAIPWPWDPMLRLTAAAVFGGAIGLERELRGRRAGFRTHLLVCLGSALAMVVSIRFGSTPWPDHTGFNVNIDPARVAYGVMAGVGFLGAGAIVHDKGQVSGLTTAAAIWCVAAIGLAAGFGLYSVALFTTLLVVGVLWLLDGVERALPRINYRLVRVRRRWQPTCITETVARFEAAGLDVVDVNFRRTGDLAYVDVDLRVAFRTRARHFDIERDLDGDETYLLLSVDEA